MTKTRKKTLKKRKPKITFVRNEYGFEYIIGQAGESLRIGDWVMIDRRGYIVKATIDGKPYDVCE